MDNKKSTHHETSVRTSLIAGSTAGIFTDIALYPVDTIKTRLQSSEGFIKAGGFRGVYKGITSAAIGSAPAGASFFFAYEICKNKTRPYIHSPLGLNIASACTAEVFSISVRIPFEVVKQNAQAVSKFNSRTAFLHILKTEGIPGLYRGYVSMIFRDLPFTLIQIPLWEALKDKVSKETNRPVTALQSGLCGSVAGGTAATLTTPFDVVKTRIILAQGQAGTNANLLKIFYNIAVHEGLKGLYAGVVPRAIWISAGGFMFLGAYEKVKILLQS
ncbi:mitochondrial S-adenosylmethionine carrier protein-like [Hydractinia symbiolongicarpus]|uniref:mitochondrial S-adenosylmethionine carrier protein-like n=1 Tax=Hydractinia symbiolongicarpus TaxID=13093 RepID=UPI00254C2FE9|nr:mitochondrial S-adenosylmethionine carrier protein-like [Hydractinia symbiolongicarpus]